MNIALVGNPNAGKSSLFNILTGLRQKVGNFPGVTVDKKSGFYINEEGQKINIVDLPGTYSLYPKSLDEEVVLDILLNPNNVDHPDLVVLIVDATNIKRNLLLFTQIVDLGLPVIIALNMVDLAEKEGVEIDIPSLERKLGVPIYPIVARNGTGIKELKEGIDEWQKSSPVQKTVLAVPSNLVSLVNLIKKEFNLTNDFQAIHYLYQNDFVQFLSQAQKASLAKYQLEAPVSKAKFQSEDTLKRYEYITGVLGITEDTNSIKKVSMTEKLDRIFLHKIWGYVIFVVILFLMFQAVFTLSEIPTDLLDQSFSYLANTLSQSLGDGPLQNLLTQGLIPGIGGVFLFIPQIALLFAFIAILEESGYMARVVVLMDKLVRRFGLNGKSVVPLISAMACAVPAVMSTRTIGNWKDRLITIMVTPLMSCSARLPIYTILIALVIPNKKWLGIFGLHGITLLGLYLLGFFSALLVALVFNKTMKSRSKSFFVMELPSYKPPRWNQVGFTIVDKVKTFVFEAGKIIVAISIILWVLSSYGPPGRMEKAVQNIEANSENYETKVASAKLENSYAGLFGKTLEPVIKPLGYDWKIGIALITSFAAREVFVGTLSTIYSIGNDDFATIKDKLNREVNPHTGMKVFNVATGFSLLIFYVYAMMCMSTIAVVYRETGGWKWPIIQLAYMGGLAYFLAFVVYNLLQ